MIKYKCEYYYIFENPCHFFGNIFSQMPEQVFIHYQAYKCNSKYFVISPNLSPSYKNSEHLPWSKNELTVISQQSQNSRNLVPANISTFNRFDILTLSENLLRIITGLNFPITASLGRKSTLVIKCKIQINFPIALTYKHTHWQKYWARERARVYVCVCVCVFCLSMYVLCVWSRWDCIDKLVILIDNSALLSYQLDYCQGWV